MEFVYKPEEQNDIKEEEDLNASKRRRVVKPPRSSYEEVTNKSSAENYMVRVNWLYRPKDIQKKSPDSRLLYVTMNSDVCPIASIRGKCTVHHKDHIENLERFRSQPNCFWFDKLFDRYILSLFDVVPTEKIINIPVKAQRVLCERFRLAIVEAGRAKDLCAVPKNCVKCTQWCSPDDSVQCAHCSNHYHMLCVDPPLERKPSRGFGWSCAVCSGAREKKLSENRGIVYIRRPNHTENNNDTSSSETSPTKIGSDAASTSASSSSPSAGPSTPPLTRAEELAQVFDGRVKSHKLTAEQKRQLRLWPFRYLGIHAKIEDVLDMDDRIYPRAASRLGAKHQCSVTSWPGRPVVYYECDKPEKKKGRWSKTTTGKAVKLVQQDADEEMRELLQLEKSKRPAWLQEKPSGYIERGGDETATLLWKTPPNVEIGPKDQFDLFLENIAGPLAKEVGVEAYTPNYIDACLKAYMDCGYNGVEASQIIKRFTRDTLKEPTFSSHEIERFENGVRQFGSELHEVYKVVKTKSPADIVRFYYLWKKTPNGHKIWDNFEGRRHKMKPEFARSEGELVDAVADNFDDSKFDFVKAQNLHRTFICKHCHTTDSEGWQRAPGYPSAGDSNPIIALCLRCARLWRRYAVVWEDPEEVVKKQSQRGSYGVKRIVEQELIEDAMAILIERNRQSEARHAKKSKLESSLPISNGTGKGAKRNSASLEPSSSPTRSAAIEVPLPKPTPETTPVKVRQKPGPKKGWKIAKAAAEAAAAAAAAKSGKDTSNPKSTLTGAIHEGSDTPPVVVRKKPGPKPKPKPIVTHPAGGQRKLISSSPVQLKTAEGSSARESAGSTPKSTLSRTTPDNVELATPQMIAPRPALLENPVDFVGRPIPIAERAESSPLVRSSADSAINLNPSVQNNDNHHQLSTYPPKRYRPPCQICMSLGPAQEQLYCSKCNINVHRECYGVDSTESGAWQCDACLNDARPQVSVMYDCILCPARENNGNISPPVRPQAVKRTFGDNWAHVRCGIWIEGLVFGDVDHRQPLEGISALKTKDKLRCELCASTSGVCISCPHCEMNVHAACAERAGFQLKIEVEPASDPSVLGMEYQGMRVTAKAVVLCPDAFGRPNTHDPLSLDIRSGKTLLQLYIDAYKRYRGTETGARKMAALYSCADSGKGIESTEISTVSPHDESEADLDDLEYAKVATHICSECASKSSPIWWNSDPGELCHVCYWKRKDLNKYNESYGTQRLNVIKPLPRSLKSTLSVNVEMIRSSKYAISPQQSSSPSSSRSESFEGSNRSLNAVEEADNDTLKDKVPKMSLQDILIS